MTVAGADVDELRSTAKKLTQAADRLQSSVKGLSTLISNSSMWRGADADQFRSEWKGQSVHSINAAVDKLRSGAEALRRNADQQETASRGDGGAISGSGSTNGGPHEAAQSTNAMWHAVKDIPHSANSSGYRVQKIDDGNGHFRYIVYIGGTDGSDGQTKLSNVPAAQGHLDQKQLDALKRLIDPPGSEVMLVGFSQGGMDAQNIAHSKELNVTQIVTFGSPSRPDLDIPAVHLRASGDQIPNSTTGAAAAGLWAIPVAGAIGGPIAANVAGAAEISALTSPYVGSTFEWGGNNEFFHGDSKVDGDMWNHHNNGYENVSQEYDKATEHDTAGKMDKHVTDFKGTVVGDVYLDMAGNGDW